MKRIYYIIVLLFISSGAISQNLVDALRYSDFRLQGTARSVAMGNAFGALGGDFTSASINPAGLGIYRSSEFVITPNVNRASVDASYLGMTTEESKYNLGFQNVGYVANFNMSNSSSSLVSLSLGVGYNRLGSFDVKKMVHASGVTSSMLDQFSLNADGYEPWELDPFYEELAAYDESSGFGTNLIFTEEENEDLIYGHDMQVNPFTNDLTNYEHGQRKSFSQKGNIDEYVISLAANFNHKFYVGATVGIQDVYFRETTSLFEYDENNNIEYFNDYTFNTYLRTAGTGVNFKLGAIFKPTNELRLGVAVHTPTFYKLQDNFDNTMYSSLDLDDGSADYEALSPVDWYNYQLETPFKAIFSGAYVFGKSAILSVDYEFVDYSTIKLRDGDGGYDFFNENDEIGEAYKAVGNLHLGLEYRIDNNFSLRGGYERYPSPFNKNAFGEFQPNSNADDSAISAGFGWKQGGFFLDAAYKHEMNEQSHEVYAGSDLAKFNTKLDDFVFTVGFRF
ncbi:OmpP1/FadL family transporter [Sunxiuqinia sp. A32]|uniref:OmpP1/FadL family transporter n=1 Tax=Sunxiuqinia sp. A32 TaxID=3461496 RepID=UPI00404540EE